MEGYWFEWSTERKILWASKGHGKILVAKNGTREKEGGWTVEFIEERDRSTMVRLVEFLGAEAEMTIFPPDDSEHYQRVYTKGLASSANRRSYIIFHPAGWEAAQAEAARKADRERQMNIPGWERLERLAGKVSEGQMRESPPSVYIERGGRTLRLLLDGEGENVIVQGSPTKFENVLLSEAEAIVFANGEW